jgi:RHS repeat-associated protein
VGANAVGRLIEARTTNCVSGFITDEWFRYTPRGQVSDVYENTPHSGGVYHTSATYFANGVVNTLSGIPGYSTLTFGVDADGMPSTATLGTTTIVAAVSYGPLGPLDIDIGTGTDDDEYVYSTTTGRLTQYQFFVGSANTKGVLTWDTDGNLGTLAVTDGFNAGGTHTCNFAYDDVSRLITDDCGATWLQNFSYDNYNNLTKSGNSSWMPGYNTKNQYSAIGATYNANGTLSYDSTNHVTWDSFGKMTGVGSAVPVCGTSGTCITYDALGRAVEKSVNAVYSEILYSPIGQTAVMSGATTVTSARFALPGGGDIITTGTGGSIITYEHKDWLGTARVGSSVTAATVTYDRAFAPYGEVYANFGATDKANFTGDRQDLFAGLSDTPNRELNNGQGRWISPDPAGSGWNAYAYGTDPNTQTDPTGLSTWIGNPFGSLGSISGYGGSAGFDFGFEGGATSPWASVPANAAPPSSPIGSNSENVCGGGIGSGSCGNQGDGPPRTNDSDAFWGQSLKGIVTTTLSWLMGPSSIERALGVECGKGIICADTPTYVTGIIGGGEAQIGMTGLRDFAMSDHVLMKLGVPLGGTSEELFAASSRVADLSLEQAQRAAGGAMNMVKSLAAETGTTLDTALIDSVAGNVNTIERAHDFNGAINRLSMSVELGNTPDYGGLIKLQNAWQ